MAKLKMARTIIIGRLTKDVELRYTQGGEPMAVASFSIAENKKHKKEGQPEASFWDCVAFREKAEFIAKYFRKGSKMVVDGIGEDETYVTKDGVKKTVKRVTVEYVDFADSKGGDGTASGTAQPVQNATQTPQTPAQTPVQTQTPAPAQQKAVSSKARATKPAAPAPAPAPAPQAIMPQQSAFMNVEGFDLNFVN